MLRNETRGSAPKNNRVSGFIITPKPGFSRSGKPGADTLVDTMTDTINAITAFVGGLTLVSQSTVAWPSWKYCSSKSAKVLEAFSFKQKFCSNSEYVHGPKSNAY